MGNENSTTEVLAEAHAESLTQGDNRALLTEASTSSQQNLLSQPVLPDVPVISGVEESRGAAGDQEDKEELEFPHDLLPSLDFSSELNIWESSLGIQTSSGKSHDEAPAHISPVEQLSVKAQSADVSESPAPGLAAQEPDTNWIKALKEAASQSQSEQVNTVETTRPLPSLESPQLEFLTPTEEDPAEDLQDRPSLTEQAERGDCPPASPLPPTSEHHFLPVSPPHLHDSAEFPTPPPTPPERHAPEVLPTPPASPCFPPPPPAPASPPAPSPYQCEDHCPASAPRHPPIRARSSSALQHSKISRCSPPLTQAPSSAKIGAKGEGAFWGRSRWMCRVAGKQEGAGGVAELAEDGSQRVHGARTDPLSLSRTHEDVTAALGAGAGDVGEIEHATWGVEEDNLGISVDDRE
ncbi:transforming acidic coiled-coil-containing protein 2 isoform X1 [Lates japonicus]|uniref:Transforming acidic coiled-coil-containing protein 2 isoform X1 n=1 Tax=Lates japonicus TaxID=270547 RepID=A0AAD3N688_LATJO|nr:transforming acidic coiled-coil-containing protein 2 isoform X1 [Lates japonicus]